MSLLGEETVSVQHYTITRTDGRASRVADGAAFDVVCSIQPITGEVMDMLPEGARSASRWVMIVEDDPDLRISDIANQRGADRVTRTGGEVYEIGIVHRWEYHVTGLPHKVATLIEVGADE